MTNEQVRLTSLLLDQANPRLEMQEGQQDTLREMLVHQGEKLKRLAEDILDNGLNPAELPIVIPADESRGRFIVVEGNRRVAALRLAASPDLAKDVLPKSTAAAWQRIADRFAERPIESVLCAVAESREEAAHWIRLRHTGENRGAGIVAWGAIEAARFEERRGVQRPELQVLDFMREHGALKAEVAGNLNNVAITNLGRVLGDPDARARLGVDRVRGQIVTKLPRSEVIKGLRRLITDLALKRIKVSNIETKKERQEYLDGFGKHERPNLGKAGTEPVSLRDAPQTTAKAQRRKKGARATPPSYERSELIPRTFVVRLEAGKINNIFHELKRLSPNSHPNACAVLLRVFLELAVDSFLDEKKLKSSLNIHDNTKLATRVQKVAVHLSKVGTLSDEDLKPINRAVSSDQLLAASIPTFHAYVHSLKLNPDPDSLKNAWDSLEDFLEAVLPLA